MKKNDDEVEKVTKNMKLEGVIEDIIINREKKKPIIEEIERMKPYESEWKKKIKSKKEVLSATGFMGIICTFTITMAHILSLSFCYDKSSDYYFRALFIEANSDSYISETKKYIELSKKWRKIGDDLNIYKKIFDGGKENGKE